MTGEQSELNEILDLSLIADVLQILNFWLNLKQGRFEMAWIAGIAHPLLS